MEHPKKVVPSFKEAIISGPFLTVVVYEPLLTTPSMNPSYEPPLWTLSMNSSYEPPLMNPSMNPVYEPLLWTPSYEPLLWTPLMNPSYELPLWWHISLTRGWTPSKKCLANASSLRQSSIWGRLRLLNNDPLQFIIKFLFKIKLGGTENPVWIPKNEEYARLIIGIALSRPMWQQVEVS